MNQYLLETSLNDLPIGVIEYHDKVGSTNDLAVELSKNDAPDLSLIVANEQTKGRGRSGRTWFTPPDSALAFSLVMDPGVIKNQEDLSRITGLGALAVCEGLKDGYDLYAEIKWPNDVLLNRKKVCGVLAEAHWTGNSPETLILGIGINIAPDSVPPSEHLNFPAISVEEIVGKKVDRISLLKAIIIKIILWKEKVWQPEFINTWIKYLAYMDDTVQILSNDTATIEGKVIGLDESGRLILRLPNSQDIIIHAGEILMRPLIDR